MINPEEIEYRVEIKENEIWVHNSLPKIIEFLPKELQEKLDKEKEKDNIKELIK